MATQETSGLGGMKAFFNPDETYCRENDMPINRQLYL